MAKRKDETVDEYNARQRERQRRTREQRADYMLRWRNQRQAAGLPTIYRNSESRAQPRRAEWLGAKRADMESRGYVAFESKGRIRYRHPALAYKITPAHFEAMLLTQCGRCAVCGAVMPHPQIDHDHRTGRVRGLLCGRCNRSIHIVEEHLTAALAYLGIATGQAA